MHGIRASIDTRPAQASLQSRTRSPLATFLDQLKRPLVQFHDVLLKFGITSEEDLDVLCGLPDQWGVLHAFLAEKGNVTQLEWMIIRAGLEARARAIDLRR